MALQEAKRGDNAVVSALGNPLEREQYEKYAYLLRETVRTYGIGNESFDFPSRDVAHVAILLLHDFDIDAKFLEENPENGLLTLSIAERIMSLRNAFRKGMMSNDERVIEEERALLGFSLLTFLDFPKGSTYTRSGYMAARYTKDLQRKLQEMPSIERDLRASTDLLAPSNPTFHWRDHIDREVTRALNLEPQPECSGMTAWEFTRYRRQVLDIPEEQGKINGIYVLDVDSDELEELGAGRISGFTIVYGDGGSEIVLAKNWERNTLEHELNHGLSKRLARGYRALVDAGLEEATTEDLTTNPQTYRLQRNVLQTLYNDLGQEFKKLWRSAYKGDSKAKRKAREQIIKAYGLQAIYFLTFLSPGVMQFQVNKAGHVTRIYRDSDEVQKYLSEHKRSS